VGGESGGAEVSRQKSVISDQKKVQSCCRPRA
jgi:hypothetical protein